MKFEKVQLYVLLAIVVGGVLFVIYYERQPKIDFQSDRKEIYVEKGTRLHPKKLRLESFNNKWYVIDKNELPIEIYTPYSMQFGEKYDVILEANGKLAMVSKDRLERLELKWMDNQWKHKDPSTTEWLEFAEQEPPEPDDNP